MKTTLCFCVLLIGVYAQPSPTDQPVETETVLGMSVTDFQATQQALLEANDDPRVAALNRQIERLIEQRDALMFEAAKEKRPHLKTRLDQVAAERAKHRRPENPGNGNGRPGNGG